MLFARKYGQELFPCFFIEVFLGNTACNCYEKWDILISYLFNETYNNNTRLFFIFYLKYIIRYILLYFKYFVFV